MRRADFHYDLPPGLIAQRPLAERRASRLLSLDGPTGERRDLRFSDLPGLLRCGDLLVFNDTRVMPARLFARKPTGGRIEVLIERLLGADRALAHCRAGRPLRPPVALEIEGGATLLIEQREGDFWQVRAPAGNIRELLERFGHTPLPPYIECADEGADRERYQTVYARRDGAVAAPTAGLHFDREMLAELDAMGVRSTQITLHVGAGTFQPVRVERIETHRMHPEWLEVGESACARVRAARAAGGRVIAVGTTSVRSLETAAAGGRLAPYRGESRLFIYPGYRFRVVDGLVTNFHLPQSTLLMLVSAFAGHSQVMAAYRHAVASGYRFFSYGDAMFSTRQK